MNEEEYNPEDIQDEPAAEMPEETPEQIPEEDTQQPEQPQYTDEELDSWAMQRMLSKPDLVQRFAGFAGPTPPVQPEQFNVPVPDDMDWQDAVNHVASKHAEKMVTDALAPLQQEIEKMRYDQQLGVASVDIGKRLGGDHYVEPVKQILASAGPKGLEMYNSNPEFQQLVNDAAAHRAGQSAKPQVREQKPLPKADSGVGAKPTGYRGEDRELAEKFDRDFAELGVSFKDVNN